MAEHEDCEIEFLGQLNLRATGQLLRMHSFLMQNDAVRAEAERRLLKNYGGAGKLFVPMGYRKWLSVDELATPGPGKS